jgi:hypothetical protein
MTVYPTVEWAKSKTPSEIFPPLKTDSRRGSGTGGIGPVLPDMLKLRLAQVDSKTSSTSNSRYVLGCSQLRAAS